MFLVYRKKWTKCYEEVGYVETFEDFVEYCKSIGLEQFMNTNSYGEHVGGGYYFNMHYAEKIEKLVISQD